MSEWLTTAEIAEKLFVSVNTVRTHVRNILTKLGVSRRNAAIREALRLGLLTPEPESAAASRLVWPT
jgi:LuxR family transcriptional regulator, maltose regulon positive regulatory protein